MADFVVQILREADEKARKYKSVGVNKNLVLDFDVGNLLAVDINPVNYEQYRNGKELYLKASARDNLQLLVNKIWELPIDRVEDAIVAKSPKPKLPTKWEKYACSKGIKKKKRGNLVWDDIIKEWVPRYGFKHAKVEQEKNWLIEVPGNADQYEDQFSKRTTAKKERVAKNEYQRLRNIAKVKKVNLPRVGIAPTEKQSKDQVGKAIILAKSSTASLGKFTKNVANEKPSRKQGKKRKFEALIGCPQEERKRNLTILNNLSSKKPELDFSKAVNQQIMVEENQPRQKIPKRRSKAGEKKGGKNRGKGKIKYSGK